MSSNNFMKIRNGLSLPGLSSAPSGSSNGDFYFNTTSNLFQGYSGSLFAFVGDTLTQTLTNKTLTSPTINGGTHTAITDLAIRDTSAAFDVTLAATSSVTLTLGRTITIDTTNISSTLKMGGNLTVGGNSSINGTFSGTSSGSNTGDQTITLTGNVTGSGTGSFATTIGSNVVTNSMLAQMPTFTIKGNNTSGTANALDLTISQVNTMLGSATSIGTYSNTSTANGLDITSNVLTLHSADGTNPGAVSNTTQSFVGAKTFNTSLDSVGPLSIHHGTDLTTTGSSNNVSTSGFSFLRYNGSASATISGFANGSDGKFLILVNASSFSLTLLNNSGSSSAGNQIYTGTGASLVIATNASVHLQYDSQSSYWRVIGGSGGSSNLNVNTTTTGITIGSTTTLQLVNQSAAITMTLPVPTAGAYVQVKDISGTAYTNPITIQQNANETIDGQKNIIINDNWGSLEFASDGTNWFLI